MSTEINHHDTKSGKPRATQLIVAYNDLFALCDDGSIWKFDGFRWFEINPPGEPTEEDIARWEGDAP